MEHLRILIIDDDPDLSQFIKFKLSLEAQHFSITELKSAQECLDFLKDNEVDCILSDYSMPGMNGMALLLALREQGNDVPFIFLTAQGNEQVAREAFRNGAADYFTKDLGFAHFARIINSVEQAIKRRVSERAIEEQHFWMIESQRVARLGSYVLDIPAGRWTSSDILDEIFGIEKDAEKTVESWVSLIHPEDRERMVKYFANDVLSKKQKFQADYRIIRKNDGEERFVSGLGELIMGQNGDPVTMLGTIQDITERKRAERALIESETRNKKILEAIPDIIFRMTKEGIFIDMNYTNEADLYAPPSKIVGRRLTDLVPPEVSEKAMDCISRALNTGEMQFIEYQLPMSRGIEYYEARIVASENNEVLSIIRNITERKHAEEERSAFINMLTHDIKGPLSLIKGYCEMFNDSLKGEEGKEIAASIKKAAGRISSLINDMLAVSSSESNDFKLQIQPVDFSHVIMQAVHDGERLASEKQVTVAVEIEDGLPILYADPVQLTRAFSNLVSNAVFYNEKGGKVSVKVSNPDGCKSVTVIVADNGQGIAQEDVPYIFNKYYRGRRNGNKSGTGLGLAIVKAAIEAHDGTISVQSVKGEGSTFTVVLPVKPALN